MAKTPKLRLIRDRLRENDSRLEALRAEIVQIESTSGDLRIAERVLLSLGGDDEGDEAAPAAVLAGNGHMIADMTVLPAAQANKKPDNLPTMTFMIEDALRAGLGAGHKFKPPMQILQHIQLRFWPGCTLNSVGPIAWRLYKRGRLTKRGNKYGLPEPNQMQLEENQ